MAVVKPAGASSSRNVKSVLFLLRRGVVFAAPLLHLIEANVFLSRGGQHRPGGVKKLHI